MSKSKIKIGIVGYGYVGKAFHAFFKDHYEVLIRDPLYADSVSKEEINECEFGCSLCTTPSNADVVVTQVLLKNPYLG